PSTLEKLTTRCGPEAVEQVNQALLAIGYAAKVIKTNRVRSDTTVVPANVTYPTDSGLLATAIDRIAVLAARIHAAGGAPRTHVRDRRRSAPPPAPGQPRPPKATPRRRESRGATHPR